MLLTNLKDLIEKLQNENNFYKTKVRNLTDDEILLKTKVEKLQQENKNYSIEIGHLKEALKTKTFE